MARLTPSLTDRHRARHEARAAVARQVLSACAGIDALTEEASVSLDIDDDRLFALLETREQMLLDLSEQVAMLQQTRATVDSPLMAATERAVDEADALIASVCEALASSERATQRLATRVAARVEMLRDELTQVSRASSAGSAYQLAGRTHAVDLRR